MKKKPITEETRAAVLAAAWELIEKHGRADVSQSEIAAAAGVSRQTIFYAFGNRAGLLTAMVRHRDARSARLADLRAIGARDDASLAGLLDLVGAWLDYLPEVYPVGVLLDAAGLTDAEARAAIEDRMVTTLLAGFRRRMALIAAAGGLPPGADPDRIAETIWEAVHFPAWRLLVVGCGWTPAEFRDNRLALVRRLVDG